MIPDPATRAREIVIGCHVRHRGFSREQVERAYAEWSMDACAECIAAALTEPPGRGPETGPDVERLYRALLPLLASYQADAPHWDEEKGYYPAITLDEMLAHLQSEHDGDCTNEPQPCLRCHAESRAHEARWLAERLVSTPGSEAPATLDGPDGEPVVISGHALSMDPADIHRYHAVECPECGTHLFDPSAFDDAENVKLRAALAEARRERDEAAAAMRERAATLIETAARGMRDESSGDPLGARLIKLVVGYADDFAAAIRALPVDSALGRPASDPLASSRLEDHAAPVSDAARPTVEGDA